MINAKMEWHGDEYKGRIDAAAWDTVRRLTLFFWNAVQATLNLKVNPPPYDNSSAPGEPPAKRTGFLAANVLYEFDKPALVGRVGVTANAIYGLFLEVGTRFMKARPWLEYTLNKVKAQLQEIVKRGNH